MGWWGASSAIAEANKKNQENYDQKSEMALRNAHVNTDELKNIMEAHAKGDDAPLNNKFNQLKITPPVLIVEKPPTADDTPWERAGELKDGMVKNLEDAGKFVKGMGQNALDAGKELIKGVPSGMAPDKEGLINNLVSHGASLDEAQKAVDALYEHPDTSKAVRDLSNMLKEKEALKNAKPEPWRPGQDVDLTSRTDDLKNNEPGAGVGVPDNVSLKPMDILQWIGKTKSDKVDENTKSSMGINQGNQQVAGASTSGDQQNMAAGNTRDQAGADAQNTMNQSANQTAAEQQKNSWKNVLGDSLAQSLAAGGAGFGGAVGGQAAAQAGSTLWGSGHPSPGVGQPLGPAVDGKSADATGTQGGTPGSSAVGSPTSLGGKAGTLAKGSPGTKGGKSGTVAKGGPGAKGKPVSGAGAQPEAGAESTPKGCYDSYIKTYGKPTGYMSDGRPYWGDGSKNNPFTSHDIPRPIIGTVIKDPGAVGLAPVAAGKKTPSGQPTTTSTPKTEYCSKCGRPMTYVTKAAPGDPNGPLSRWYNCPYCDAQKTVKKPTPSGPNSVIMGEDWMKKPIPIKCPACKIGTINADAPYPKHPYCPNCNWVLN
ncbi:MAG: hypothetical protein NTY53_22035 [Kiritimatiellaeota bacterium]|nr:hypothetical protein [Kiritimatiellota bacterium]